MTKSINIFTGAEKGFLASNLKNQIKGINYDYGDVLLYKEYNHINKIFHFAGQVMILILKIVIEL